MYAQRRRDRVRALITSIAFLLVSGGLTAATALPALAAGCPSGRAGDVNGDGYAEVAVSESGGVHPGGAVHVFYGQRAGLAVDATGTAREDQFFAQDTAGVPGSAEAGDGFGAATALGDFDDDGCADLAVGSPGENDGTGLVTILYGSTAGIRTAGAQTFSVAGLFGSGASASNQEFGDALTVADLDGDNADDLAVGAPTLRVSGVAAGRVAVVFGDIAGLNRGSTVAALLTQNTAGVPGTAAGNGFFGAALTTGDFDGDDRAELAIGAFGDAGGGTVVTLERDANGFVPRPGVIDRASAGVPEAGAGEYEFGGALAAGDVTGDERDDLAVGVPRWDCLECDEFQGKGAVALLKGSPSGVTTAGGQFWTQDSPGVEGVAERDDDGFGSPLAIGPLDRDAYADLAVGAPGDAIVDGIEGSVTVLRGSSIGLTTAGIGGKRFHQDTPGIGGSTEAGDQFGNALVVTFVQSRTQASLVVGARSEDVSGVSGAGQFYQLAISGSGPTGTGSRTLHLDSAGVKGSSSRNANFGLTVS